MNWCDLRVVNEVKILIEFTVFLYVLGEVFYILGFFLYKFVNIFFIVIRLFFYILVILIDFKVNELWIRLGYKDDMFCK